MSDPERDCQQRKFRVGTIARFVVQNLGYPLMPWQQHVLENLSHSESRGQMSDPEEFKKAVTKRVMTKLRVGSVTRVSQEVLDGTDVNMVADIVSDVLVMHLETKIWAEPARWATATEEFLVPATVWQHFKQDHMPQWFKDRWPVQMTRHRVNVEAKEWRIYPQSTIPIRDQGKYAYMLETTTTKWRGEGDTQGISEW
jgi:hypothetical protein